MRIRKRGNARTGESSGAQRHGGVGGSHQVQLVASSLQVAQDSDTVANEIEGDTLRNTGEEEVLGRSGISISPGVHERAGIGDAASDPSPTLVVDLWPSGSTAFTPAESYMNLDEFVRSLAREKCFPVEESGDFRRDSGGLPEVQIGDSNVERLAGGSSMAPQSSPIAELDTSLRLGQASQPAMATREERGKSKLEFESDSDSDNDGREILAPEFHLERRDNPRAGYGTSGDGALEGRNQRNSPEPSPSPIEECDESHTVRRSASKLADAQVGLEPSPSQLQTMKSSTEGMEPWECLGCVCNSCQKNLRQRDRNGHSVAFSSNWFSKTRRVSEDSPNRRRLPSPAPATSEEPLAADHPAKQPRSSPMFLLYTVYHEAGREGLTAGEAMDAILQGELPGSEAPECRSRRHVTKLLRSSPYFMELGEGKFALCSAMIDQEDDLSEEEAGSDSSQRPEASRLPVSSSSLAMTDNEERKQEVEVARKVSESGGTPTAGASSQQTERKPSGRSGRPKRLKYLKQENVEELGNQCNRSDGKGWTCPLLAKTGYQLCDHHLDKLRCKPGSRSKYNKKKKKHN